MREEETGGVGADVLGHEEHTKSHAPVFGPPAFHQFGFGFGHVERHTFHFGDHRHEEQRCTERHQEDVPCTGRMLEVDAFDDVERAREDGHREQGEQQRNLVGGELSRRANTTDEGVLVVGRPSGKEDANGRNTKDGDGVENGQVRVGGVNAAGERNHAQNQQRRGDDKEG